jgi:hypothetical protein
VEEIVQMTIDILEWSRSGVFLAINARDSQVYISHSNNMLNAMTKLLERFKIGDGWEYQILETFSGSTRNRMLIVQKYIEIYNKSFSVLNKKIPLKYTPGVQVINGPPFRVEVFLRSRNNRKMVVGVFKKMKDAIEFLDKHYSVEVTKIVHATNELTREYLDR